MLESVLTVAMLGIIGMVFLAGLGTALLSGERMSERVTAVRLAESQLEYAKRLPYLAPPASYDTVDVEGPFTVSCNSEMVGDGNKSKLTATVSRGGRVLLTLEDYKVNR